MIKPFFYPSLVLDNEDPLMLGRIRARVLTDNYNDIISSISPAWDEEKDAWTSRDPFLFNSLLPYFIYQVPKKDELVYAFYYNNETRFQNQYYVQATFSSPTTSPFEYYVGSQKWTGVGSQYKTPLPLKNQDGTYASKKNEGVFPEPGDNALLGRGSADLIVKENEVLLRAGKTIGKIQPNQIPAANNTRAFLQLSQFQNIKSLQDTIIYTEKLEKTVLVKYLIEWVIINPENTLDIFRGNVYLYKLKPDIKTNSKELKVNSNIDNLKSLIYAWTVDGGVNEISNKINDILKICNNQEKVDGKTILYESPFPFFYRPDNATYNKMVSTPDSTNPSIISSNLNKIYSKIRLNTSTQEKGFGLVYAKNKIGFPFETNEKNVPIFKYNNSPTTFGAIGADRICLLSHRSTIPGKGKINFDGTLYGISNDNYTDEIFPKTSSSVRGEELLELLNLIVRFLITHTHAFPGLPPVPVTQDGSNVSQILVEMQNAVNKILNQNIRLN